ncbi:twin-arginine translocase TatA/TatE family subunit [Nocardioides sp. S-58]|uniref:Twin-arginine translocase TatA/TatE family subunit n=1 Tax=Nocardioides renjunii TaxID=3095075 RepID=A0ABU5K9M4_9ACTN|nr:twin-arginine translocase TatA/TatE family subunit [Nocardioides sp. S-58]MDZ5661677.1 twin-arginine translocase TatA/TatE family subunit [Nocardioides sp. S-58]
MFGIGLPELAVIAFFAVVLMGPDKLPGLAKQLAQGIKTAKRMGDSVRDDLRSSLGEEYSDLELRDLNPRELIRRQVEEALAERDDPADTDEDDDEPEPQPELVPHATPDERKTA